MSQMITDVQNYISGGTMGGYIALGFYAVVALLALIGMLKGLSRGILRQTVRTLTVGLSALSSFVLCQKIYPLLSTYLDGKDVPTVLEDVKGLMAKIGLPTNVFDKIPATAMNILKAVDVNTFRDLLAAPLGVIILPLLFVLLFIVISALMLIIHALICAILGFQKERNNGSTRFLGMLLGLAQGAAVGALIFLPILGITNFVAEPIKSLDEGNTIRVYYTDYAEPLNNSALADVVMNKAYGKQVLDAIGTLDSGKEGEAVVKTQKLGEAALSLMDDVTALKGIDIKNLTAEQEDSIKALIQKLDNKDDEGMAGLKTILVGVLKGTVDAVNEDPSVLPLGDLDATVKDLVIDLLGVFSTISEDTVVEDLTTVSNLLFILSDNSVLGDMSDIANTFTKPALDKQGNPILNNKGEELNIVKAIIFTLDQNERTRGLVDALSNFAVSLMMPKGMDIQVDMNNVKEGFADIARIDASAVVVNEDGSIVKDEAFEAYAEEVSGQLDQLLADNEITGLEPEVQEQMGTLVAEYLLTNDVNPEELSTEQMADMLLTYLDASKKPEATPAE